MLHKMAALNHSIIRYTTLLWNNVVTIYGLISQNVNSVPQKLINTDVMFVYKSRYINFVYERWMSTGSSKLRTVKHRVRNNNSQVEAVTQQLVTQTGCLWYGNAVFTVLVITSSSTTYNFGSLCQLQFSKAIFANNGVDELKLLKALVYLRKVYAVVIN